MAEEVAKLSENGKKALQTLRITPFEEPDGASAKSAIIEGVCGLFNESLSSEEVADAKKEYIISISPLRKPLVAIKSFLMGANSIKTCEVKTSYGPMAGKTQSQAREMIATLVSSLDMEIKEKFSAQYAEAERMPNDFRGRRY